MTKPAEIVVYSELQWRVRLIPDPPQFVIEKKSKPGAKIVTWAGHSWCQTRDALVRCWKDKTGNPAPKYLTELPDRARDQLAQLKKKENAK